MKQPKMPMKYRLWDATTRTMWTWAQILSFHPGEMWLDQVTVHPMLWTGLTDENGTEIYIGDLVRDQYDASLWQIIWHELGIYMVRASTEETTDEEDLDPQHIPHDGQMRADYLTVVSNIYQHSYLFPKEDEE